MMVSESTPVVILGGGINGSALARELVLNRIPVILVDTHDLSWGATARSSRLIHGGLRYLEYGEFHLVRESLAERARLLKLAPQFVHPLRLYIPVRQRFGGMLRAATSFLGVGQTPALRWLSHSAIGPSDRGLWTVQAGLMLYDTLAADSQLPGHEVVAADAPGVPRVDTLEYHWLCAYSDAQIRYPERLVVAMLDDARRHAREQQVFFQVLPYHRAVIHEGELQIAPATGRSGTELRCRPEILVNATGAWGDFTLQELHVPAGKLFGGTKGSHFVTYHAGLRDAICGHGVYAEAQDGRLIFVLPFGDAVLVGTTDEHYTGDPGDAVASPEELDYLLRMVNEVFAGISLSRSDIEMHYSGVRPLPSSSADSTAAITRDHLLDMRSINGIPLLTLVGGKLTTCRALAEQVADRLLTILKLPRVESTHDRPVSGGDNYPSSAELLDAEIVRIAERLQLTTAQVRAVWSLCGSKTETVLEESLTSSEGRESLPGTDLPRGYARWVIRHEWVETLDDLIERRLMLLFHPQLRRCCLRMLAEDLQELTGGAPDIEGAVEVTVRRLSEHYGKTIIG